MRPPQRADQEPLLPPWVARAGLILGPIVGLILIYYLLTAVFNLPPKILVPALAVLVLAAFIYFAGRLYKPFFVNREGRCTARGAKARESCRHFVPGARLGGGCGRLMENGRCRYVH